jgi:hypothetical protein
LEFLRAFDVTDHDPSRTLPEIQDFVRVLRALFAQGYVVCDAGEVVVDLPGLGKRKTLAQIAMENINGPMVIRRVSMSLVCMTNNNA